VGPELKAAFPYGRRSRGRCGELQLLVSVIGIGRHNSSLSLLFVAVVKRQEWGQRSWQHYGRRGCGRFVGSLLLISVIGVSRGSWSSRHRGHLWWLVVAGNRRSGCRRFSGLFRLVYLSGKEENKSRSKRRGRYTDERPRFSCLTSLSSSLSLLLSLLLSGLVVLIGITACCALVGILVGPTAAQKGRQKWTGTEEGLTQERGRKSSRT
jgi:hypothetical protein